MNKTKYFHWDDVDLYLLKYPNINIKSINYIRKIMQAIHASALLSKYSITT